MFTLVNVRKTLFWNTFIALCMLSGKAAATPVITGVSAPNGLVNGQQLTIQGKFVLQSPGCRA